MNVPHASIVLGLALIGFVFSALFSGMETGLYVINRVRLAVRASRGEAAAVRVRNELQHSNRTLTVLLIGNNAANYLGSFGLAEFLHQCGLNDWPLIIAEALIFTPLLFICAETLPKDLFRTHTDHWTYSLSRLLVVCRWVFTITGLLAFVTGAAALLTRTVGRSQAKDTSARQRISRLLREGVGTGVITESQTTLADRALAMRGRTVGDEMIPWPEVITLPASCSREQREERMRRNNFTRLPVVGGDGKVAGVVEALDAALQPHKSTADLLSPVKEFAPGVPVHDALREMRIARQTMAVITDQSTGRPLGLVTLKDLVEPLTGELAAW